MGKLKFLGSCDRYRQTDKGEMEWQEMMKTRQQISESAFLSKININDVLDEGESWKEYKNTAKMQGDPIKFYKSKNKKYFFQTAGFEFIWGDN